MTDRHPQVSIGLPVYNGEDFLSEALDSIQAQTFDDFELVISDNGSSDQTEELCRDYARFDRRIRYYRAGENLGAAWNFNRVFHLSKGRYFKWAAHDDLIAPEFLSKCVQVLEEYPEAVLVYPIVTMIDEASNAIMTMENVCAVDQSTPGDRFHKLIYSFVWEVVFGLCRSEVLMRTGLIGAFSNSDTILLAELALHGTFHEIPERLFFLRKHGNRSVRANPSIVERMAWFDTSLSGRLLFPYWRLMVEYTRAVRRANLPMRDTLACYMHVGRWVRFNTQGLVEDVRRLASKLLVSPRVR